MPAALPINWDLAKMLYAQGLSSARIAIQVGCESACIRNRASREKWRDTVSQIGNAVAQRMENLARAPLKERAAQFVEVMANDCDDTLTKVRRQPIPKGMPELLERESVLEKLNKRARLTYGLDSVADSGVNIGLVQNITVNTAPQPMIAAPGSPENSQVARVIDVDGEA